MRVAIGAALLLTAALAAAPAPSRGACVVPSRLPPVSQAWIPISPDPLADARLPGYAILVEFVSRPGGEVGRGLFVRLSDGEEGLFRLERRDWAMRVELRGALALQYVYLDRARPSDLWVYRPQERRIRRSQVRAAGNGDPIYTVCDTVYAADLAPGIELTAATVGRVKDSPELRRALSPHWSRCR